VGATAEAIGRVSDRYPDLRPYLPRGADLPDVRTLEGFLDELQRAETASLNSYRKLVAMADAGLDKAEDYAIYGELQTAIYKAQLSGINLVIAVANGATGGAAGILLWPLLTPPEPLPAMTWSGRHASQSLNGLGWIQVAGVIAAALATLGLLYLYSEEVTRVTDDLSTVYLANARAAQQTELLEARRAAFENCMGRGGSDPEDCRAEVLDLVPTPREAGTEVPDELPPRASPWSTFGWFAIGGVIVVAIGAGLFFYVRSGSSGGFGGYHNVPLTRIAALPAGAKDLNAGASRYNLEVRR
jgi:hypothetical protein